MFKQMYLVLLTTISISHPMEFTWKHAFKSTELQKSVAISAAAPVVLAAFVGPFLNKPYYSLYSKTTTPYALCLGGILAISNFFLSPETKAIRLKQKIDNLAKDPVIADSQEITRILLAEDGASKNQATYAVASKNYYKQQEKDFEDFPLHSFCSQNRKRIEDIQSTFEHCSPYGLLIRRPNDFIKKVVTLKHDLIEFKYALNTSYNHIITHDAYRQETESANYLYGWHDDY